MNGVVLADEKVQGEEREEREEEEEEETEEGRKMAGGEVEGVIGCVETREVVQRGREVDM